MSTNDENLTLYKFEYIDDETAESIVDWIWLVSEEVDKYILDRSKLLGANYREATEDEVYLYNEAFADGYMIAIARSSEETYNGVSYRLNGFSSDHEEVRMETTKMFKCSRCDNEKEFDSDVATVSALYLTELKDDILWHVCYDCVMLQTDIESIEFDFNQEGEATS